jgi:hypothetical protein
MTRRLVDQGTFTAAVTAELSEYIDKFAETTRDAMEEVGEQSVDDLHSAGDFKGTGKYRRGWKCKIEESARKGYMATVYNTKYQLTHLLENGHNIRYHGRKVGYAKAHPHIAEVNDKVPDRLVKALQEKNGG